MIQQIIDSNKHTLIHITIDKTNSSITNRGARRSIVAKPWPKIRPQRPRMQICSRKERRVWKRRKCKRRTRRRRQSYRPYVKVNIVIKRHHCASKRRSSNHAVKVSKIQQATNLKLKRLSDPNLPKLQENCIQTPPSSARGVETTVTP